MINAQSDALQAALQAAQNTADVPAMQALYTAVRNVIPPIDGAMAPADIMSVLESSPYLDAAQFRMLYDAPQGRLPTGTWCQNAFQRLGPGNLTLTVVDDSAQLENPITQIHKSEAEKMGRPAEVGQGVLVPMNNLGTFPPMNNQGALYVNNGYFGVCVAGSRGGQYYPPAQHRTPKGATVYSPPVISEAFICQLCAGAVGNFAPRNKDPWHYSQVTEHSALGATLEYRSSNGATMRSWFLQGAPYASTEYTGAIRPSINASLRIKHISNETGGAINAPETPGGRISGREFRIIYTTGAEDFAFKIYCSASITFRLDYGERYVTPVPVGRVNPNDPHYEQRAEGPYYIPYAAPIEGQIGKLSAEETFNGRIRITALPMNGADIDTAAEALLDSYTHTIPVSGAAAPISSTQWAYTYLCMDFATGKASANSPLIVLGETDRAAFELAAGSDAHGILNNAPSLPGIRGPQSPAVGAYLQFKTSAPPARWFDESKNLWQGLNAAARAILLEQCKQDCAFYAGTGLQFTFPADWTHNAAWPAYEVFKRVCAVAELALYTDKLARDAGAVGDTAAAAGLHTSAAGCLSVLKRTMADLMNRGFVYDPVIGLVIENNSQVQPLTINFQNAAGQDHIFHYGYVIQTAAIIATLDPDWSSTALDRYEGTYGNLVNALIRNVSNPSPEGDAWFAPWRQMNWGEGHANANAINSLPASGRNEESFAEELNYWHAVQMWGKAQGKAHIEALGAVWRARCNAALQTWVTLGTAQSERAFARHFAALEQAGTLCFANTWSTSSEAQTWFGNSELPWRNNLVFNIGIQVISAIPQLLDDAVLPDWLALAGTDVRNNLDSWFAALKRSYNFKAILTPFMARYDTAFTAELMNGAHFELDGMCTRATLMFCLAYYAALTGKASELAMPGVVEPEMTGEWAPLGGPVSQVMLEMQLALLEGGMPFLRKQDYPAARNGLALLELLLAQMKQWKDKVPAKAEAMQWFADIENNKDNRYAQFQPFRAEHLSGAAYTITWLAQRNSIADAPPEALTAAYFEGQIFAVEGRNAFIETVRARNAQGVELLTALANYLAGEFLTRILEGRAPRTAAELCAWAAQHKNDHPAGKDAVTFWNAVVNAVNPGCPTGLL